MIKAIIFDLGGVILKHKPTLVEEILCEIFDISPNKAHHLWIENRVKLLKGDLSSKQFLKEINSQTGNKIRSSELYRLWRDLYIKKSDVDIKVLDLIKDLRKNYKVYLLTDTIDVHDKENKLRGVYKNFTKVFRSYKEKLAKAEDTRFFKKVLEDIKIKPEECLFIDDLEENINRAKELGMQGILYKNLTDFKRTFYLVV